MIDPYDDSIKGLSKLRQPKFDCDESLAKGMKESARQLQYNWEKLFAKYSKIDDSNSLEIDLCTMEMYAPSTMPPAKLKREQEKFLTDTFGFAPLAAPCNDASTLEGKERILNKCVRRDKEFNEIIKTTDPDIVPLHNSAPRPKRIVVTETVQTFEIRGKSLTNDQLDRLLEAKGASNRLFGHRSLSMKPSVNRILPVRQESVSPAQIKGTAPVPLLARCSTSHAHRTQSVSPAFQGASRLNAIHRTISEAELQNVLATSGAASTQFEKNVNKLRKSLDNVKPKLPKLRKSLDNVKPKLEDLIIDTTPTNGLLANNSPAPVSDSSLHHRSLSEAELEAVLQTSGVPPTEKIAAGQLMSKNEYIDGDTKPNSMRLEGDSNLEYDTENLEDVSKAKMVPTAEQVEELTPVGPPTSSKLRKKISTPSRSSERIRLLNEKAKQVQTPSAATPRSSDASSRLKRKAEAQPRGTPIVATKRARRNSSEILHVKPEPSSHSHNAAVVNSNDSSPTTSAQVTPTKRSDNEPTWAVTCSSVRRSLDAHGVPRERNSFMSRVSEAGAPLSRSSSLMDLWVKDASQTIASHDGVDYAKKEARREFSQARRQNSMLSIYTT